MSEGISFSGRERNSCLLNTADGRFADISAVSGFDYLDDARSLGFLDFDFDGDLDFWVGNRSAPRLRLMRNNSSPGDFMAFRLRGTKCNRDAIGARVEVWQEGETVPLIRTLRAGEGFLSQSSKWVHLGLGGKGFSKVVVRWPGGEAEEFSGLKENRWFDLVEGFGEGALWTPPPALQKTLTPSVVEAPANSDEARIVLSRRPIMPAVAAMPKGAATLVNVWASWCDPCLTELADFQEACEDFDKAGLAIQLWNADDPADGERDEKVRKTIEKLGLRFANEALSAAQVTQVDSFQRVFTKRHIALPVPTSFLLDREGNVAVLYRGPVSSKQVLEDLALLDLEGERLREKAIAAPGRWMSSVMGEFNPLRVAMRLFDAGETEPARDYLQTFLERRADQVPPAILADIHTTISRFEEELGNDDRAVASAEEALKANPESRRTHLQLGNTFLKERDLAKAEVHFKRALEIDAEDAEVLTLLAMAQLGQRKLPEVVESCRAAIKLSPNHVGAHYNLAFALQNLKQPAEAVRHYQRVLKLSPTWAMAANNLAWILATANDESVRDGKTALRYAESLCQSPVGKNQPIFWMTLGAARAETGDFVKAQSAVETASLLLAKAGKKSPLSQSLKAQLASYQQGKGWRQN